MFASTSSRLIALATLIALAVPATAQEVSVPDYQGDYANSLLNRRLSESMMDYQRRRMNGQRPNQRAVTLPHSAHL